MIKKEELEDLYVKKGYSQIKIGKILGCSDWKVRKYMEIYGIKIRSNREQALKYSVNENYFDNIDSHNKAYILGFLYADGFIQNARKHSSRKLGISIQEKDKKLLEDINKELESTYSIKHYNVSGGYKIGTPYVRLIISSPNLCEKVIEKGCLEHKTENLFFPTKEQVSYDLLPSFLRGYFDGDGSVYCSGSWSVRIMGTIPFLTEIINIFDLKEKKLYNRNPDSNTINRELSFKINESLDFLEFINRHKGITLDRKTTKIKEMLEYYSRL